MCILRKSSNLSKIGLCGLYNLDKVKIGWNIFLKQANNTALLFERPSQEVYIASEHRLAAVN